MAAHHFFCVNLFRIFLLFFYDGCYVSVKHRDLQNFNIFCDHPLAGAKNGSLQIRAVLQCLGLRASVVLARARKRFEHAEGCGLVLLPKLMFCSL